MSAMSTSSRRRPSCFSFAICTRRIASGNSQFTATDADSQPRSRGVRARHGGGSGREGVTFPREFPSKMWFHEGGPWPRAQRTHAPPRTPRVTHKHKLRASARQGGRIRATFAGDRGQAQKLGQSARKREACPRGAPARAAAAAPLPLPPSYPHMVYSGPDARPGGRWAPPRVAGAARVPAHTAQLPAAASPDLLGEDELLVIVGSLLEELADLLCELVLPLKAAVAVGRHGAHAGEAGKSAGAVRGVVPPLLRCACGRTSRRGDVGPAGATRGAVGCRAADRAAGLRSTEWPRDGLLAYAQMLR